MGLRLAIDRGARRGLLAAVRGYQVSLGMLLGGQCRFFPSCSCYAEEALQKGPLLRALRLITWRIARCHPLCKGGADPVPPSPAGPEYLLGGVDGVDKFRKLD